MVFIRKRNNMRTIKEQEEMVVSSHDDVIKMLMQMVSQVKLFHWQTESFGHHKALDELYSGLSDLMDEFVEVCMGKHGRPNYGGECVLKIFDLNNNLEAFLDEGIEFLISLDGMYDDKNDTDILNLRDEMMSLLNKTKYLITLK